MIEDQEEIGRRLTLIADLAVDICNETADELLLYVEPEEGAVYTSLFQRLPDKIQWVDFDKDLIEAVMDFWNDTASNKKWMGLLMVISNGRFKADFYYPDTFRDDEYHDVRRQRILEDHFGSTPIDYGEPPQGY